METKKPSSSEWVNDCGKILTSKKDPSKFYIQFDKDIVIKKGDSLIMERKADNIEKKLQKGWLTEEDAQKERERTYIKYVLHKGPSKQG